MKSLFDQVQVGQLGLKNRILRSATFELVGEPNGRASKALLDIYQGLAEGGVGTIITGMVGIDENSRITPTMLRGDQDAFVEDVQGMVQRVHPYDCKLIVQISHCGAKATYIPSGQLPLSPSQVTEQQGKPAREITIPEIQSVVDSFAKAAKRCQDGGADGVQIHAAHGYLINQFLSPTCNKRQDAYGGDIQGRARILFEVYDAIREAVGKDYPVWVKINGQDHTPDGLSLVDCCWVCRELEKRSVDAIEVSGGLNASRDSVSSRRVSGEEEEGSFAEDALKVAELVSVPVISVGGYRTPKVMEEWLNRGNLAAMSICRPLISEPALINRWQEGDSSPSRCISCNKCFTPKNGFGCQAFPV